LRIAVAYRGLLAAFPVFPNKMRCGRCASPRRAASSRRTTLPTSLLVLRASATKTS